MFGEFEFEDPQSFWTYEPETFWHEDVDTDEIKKEFTVDTPE